MKIYVGNLAKEVTDAQFAELGGPFGSLTSSVVVRERIGNESRGFGFLEYASNEEGKAAIAGLNGKAGVRTTRIVDRVVGDLHGHRSCALRVDENALAAAVDG